MQKLPVTAVILTKNEESMLPGCLATLSWCEVVIVVDSGSSDNTVGLAKKAGSLVISTDSNSFAQRRNIALKSVKTEWLLYVDADERVTPELANSIKDCVINEKISAGLLHRKNYFYGVNLQHGGWDEQPLTRLFRVSSLTEWTGEVHETPHFTGSSTVLTGELWHFSHRSVTDGLIKTTAWTPVEARLLFESGVAPVTPWTIARKMVGEIYRRGFKWGGYKDGATGWMEIWVQAINRALVYLQVWELQQHPPIPQTYQELEKNIQQQWKTQ